MNNAPRSTVRYRNLKRYWKLLLKPMSELDYKNFTKHVGFPYLVTSQDMIDELLSYDQNLAQAYKTCQRLTSAVRRCDWDDFYLALMNDKGSVVELQGPLAKLSDYANYIQNTFKYALSNGPLEGSNNKIKLIKRNAYGYQSFFNFRLRVLFTFNFKTKKHDPVITD